MYVYCVGIYTSGKLDVARVKAQLVYTSVGSVGKMRKLSFSIHPTPLLYIYYYFKSLYSLTYTTYTKVTLGPNGCGLRLV